MARSVRRGARPIPPARAAALKALAACLRGADVQAALDQALAAAPLDPRDAALATELAYGVLRLKLRLDWLLARHLSDPQGLPAPMRLALAVAAYEILHLSRIPAYASVDWCVEHAKALNPRLGKVANAVLRRLADLEGADEPAIYLADDPDRETFLARFYAAPSWLVRLWIEACGEAEAEQRLADTIRTPPLGLRVRPGPGADDLLRALAEDEHAVLRAGDGVALHRAPDDLPALLEQGRVLRQSLAGQQALHALGVRDWRGPVWDACAGRGGKSLLLSDLGLGPVLASDPSMARLKGLVGELRRLGVGDVLPVRARADRSAPLREPAPAILVDAPCSGLGVLARRPDAKLRREPADLGRLAELQARILDHAAQALAPGGVLAYVTCTLNPAENQDQVRAFLARHPAFRLETEFLTPPDSPLRECFYAARLRG